MIDSFHDAIKFCHLSLFFFIFLINKFIESNPAVYDSILDDSFISLSYGYHGLVTVHCTIMFETGVVYNYGKLNISASMLGCSSLSYKKK